MDTNGLPPSELSLHVAKSFDELEKKLENFPSDKIKKLPLLKLCECCGKLMKEAIASMKSGDQEMAYIKYVRYFTLLELIHKSLEYTKNKKTVNEMLGTQAYQMEAVRQLEFLVINLKNRYKELLTVEKGTKQVIKQDHSHTLRPESSIYFTNKPETTFKTSLTNLQALQNRLYITCQELYTMMTSKNVNPQEVLFDCRPYNDYIESKIMHHSCINVDEKIIEHGVTAGQLESHYKNDSLEQMIWKSRIIVEHVIIYDWNTNEDEPIHDTSLHILIGILENWDPDVNYKSLKFLKGGFEEFLTLYPQYTTNPKVKPPLKIIPDKTVVDDIEYPSIADITMKEWPFKVDHNNIPVINRDTKPESLKNFNVNSLKEKVDVREKLADKSVLVGKERLNAEKELKAAMIASESVQDAQTKEKELQKIIELEYNVLQLENRTQDIAEESIIVRDEINEGQEFIPDAIPKDKLKQIEEKESEAQKLKEMSEKLAREKRLAESREIISPLKIPTIDRSAKPILLPNDKIQRQPTPIIRGLTGLDNLNNTCYMNSILQCISNTNSLTVCFIKKVYTKFLNRRTKGLIVENLAVVVQSLWCGKYKSISPHNFKVAIGENYAPFRQYNQEDSQEFLGFLIDWMHTELLQMPLKISYPPSANAAEKNWLSFVANNQSLMVELFYGQFKSTIKCERCQRETAKYDTFSMINLDIPPGSGRFDLTRCLELYFNGETIEYTCERCVDKGKAVKKLNITRLPSILVIHLKRFLHTGSTSQKRTNYIKFPLEHLRMDSYIAPSEANSGKHTVTGNYKLYAVSNHYGELLNSGHYTAYCKHSVLGRWYKYDDHQVTPIDSTSVESSAAYILFYSKLPISIPTEVFT